MNTLTFSKKNIYNLEVIKNCKWKNVTKYSRKTVSFSKKLEKGFFLKCLIMWYGSQIL